MFTLVLFPDNEYYICKKTNIIKGRNSCSIKYKDGKRYAGKIIACKENYKELIALKQKYENDSKMKNRKQCITAYNNNVNKKKLRVALVENKENLHLYNTHLKTIKKKNIKKKQVITQVSIESHGKDKTDENRNVSNIADDAIDENVPEVSNNIIFIDSHGKETDENRNVLNIGDDAINENVPEVSIDSYDKNEINENRNVSNIGDNAIDENVSEISNNIDIAQLLTDSNFLNNPDTNRDILTLQYNLQTKQSASSQVQNMDTAYSDKSLEDVSFPNRFNLRNIQEEEDEDRSNITSISESNGSFYIPNSDVSKESDTENKNISKTKNKNLSKTSYSTSLETSFPLGYNVPDDTNMFVQNVECGSKKDFCIYCNTEQTKLSRHLVRKHKDKKEVKDIMYIPKGRPERRIMINKIRKNGQYLFNINSDVNTGELKVMRRPNAKFNKNATDFSICPECKGNYSKSAIRHHYRRCSKKDSSKNRSILSKSRRITCRIHESACKILRERVFPTMKDDNVSRVIRYDELAISYGNKLCEKYHDPHFYDMIRQKLRQIGRLLLEMKNQNDKIDNLFTIFVPDNYDDCLRAIRNLAGLNEAGTGFKIPSLATSLGTLLKQVCRRCITIMIKRRDKTKRKLAEEFLNLLTEDYGSAIARTAVETQLRKKRHSTILLPTKDDIKKLETYLSNKLKTAYDSLKEKFSINAWEVLAESCLLSIQLFNRRRPGEIERALIEDFQNYQKVNQSTIGTAYVSLSNDEKKAAKKYVRFTMRGKLGRNVPVLLHKQMLKNLKLLLRYRETAKVHKKNPYLFGIPGILKGDYRYLRACDLMRKYSEECGASNPDRLRGTNLRKHIATMCTNLNLRDHEISDLANFMGHADRIHKEHYRQPIISREIFQVSKLLEIVHGKDSDEEMDECNVDQNDSHQNVSLNSLDSNANKNNIDESFENNFSSSSLQVIHQNKKKRSTSPFGKCTRKRWTEEEKNIVYAVFKHHIISKTQPSFKEIQKLKDANPGILNRNCATIKAWVNNQMKKQK